MSIQSMKDFANAARADEEMASGLAAAIGERTGRDAEDAILAYARTCGFDVTAQDIEALRRPPSADGALSDDELDAVSGAGLFDFLDDAMAFTIGRLKAGMLGGLKGGQDGVKNGF
ncbi:Nif11-like leader peptide family RiPP precursor [Jiella marina]|uniref:Nif11-like leader peptide family RiPP precursor n=1 Tax=Jiella sp. LLJ827 TaxID=2917712 RepID=UPI0021006C75|nr:Nif11-like leader peptide family RiPP precursor [Jiella sp. LLJ827]MCQ0988067.1 Nif11-like leader peptide family RiPP precursor [Jiella sp. LLJ827]